MRHRSWVKSNKFLANMQKSNDRNAAQGDLNGATFAYSCKEPEKKPKYNGIFWDYIFKSFRFMI